MICARVEFLWIKQDYTFLHFVIDKCIIWVYTMGTNQRGSIMFRFDFHNNNNNNSNAYSMSFIFVVE